MSLSVFRCSIDRNMFLSRVIEVGLSGRDREAVWWKSRRYFDTAGIEEQEEAKHGSVLVTFWFFNAAENEPYSVEIFER